jgi:two-component system cell cycle response regulator DivK
MPGRHALIIDDQPNNIEVLTMLLKREGFTASFATMPYQVPDLLERTPHVDVVFLDLEMPNGDYFRLLNDLKADPRLYAVPVIAYTVHLSEIDNARKAGFDGFLGKPLRMSEFPANLARIMAGEPVWEY